jgi:hypothetical protein
VARAEFFRRRPILSDESTRVDPLLFCQRGRRLVQTIVEHPCGAIRMVTRRKLNGGIPLSLGRLALGPAKSFVASASRVGRCSCL